MLETSKRCDELWHHAGFLLIMWIAFANGHFLLALGLVVGGELLFQGIATVYIINSTSLRQACVPQELRGRAAAVVRVVSWGVGSFGALLGGILAQWSDLLTTMVAARGAHLLVTTPTPFHSLVQLSV